MTIITYKPVTPSLRHRRTLKKENVWSGKAIKFLSFGLRKHGGRNHHGHITVRHRGGGLSRMYRKIDFCRSVLKIPATIIRFEYDPQRNALIALIMYENGIMSYIIAPHGLSNGSRIVTENITSQSIGVATILKYMLVGTVIHNIERIPGHGAVFARAAGTYGLVVDKTVDGYAVIRLSSGEVRKVSLNCIATIGVVSNRSYKDTCKGKAGAARWIGIRPTVRGIAMNPVDHPHGGRTNGGIPSVSPWGYPTKCFFTKKKKHNRFVLSV